MDLNNKYKQQCYHEQNIQMRKEVRQLDMRFSYRQQGDPQPNSQCIFIVLGPPQSGKTSLLRYLVCDSAPCSSHSTAHRAGEMSGREIGCRWSVQGVKQLKETDKRFSIIGLQLNSVEKANFRYKKALQYVQGGIGGCIQHASDKASQLLARVCLICVDAGKDIAYEQLTFLKFLKVDLGERHIKTLFVLTKTDLATQQLSEGQRCIYFDNRIKQLMKDLDIKDRQDIFCIQNYKIDDYINKTKFVGHKLALNYVKDMMQQHKKTQNNEQINYYALQLLHRILRQSQRTQKLRSVKGGKSWICGWT